MNKEAREVEPYAKPRAAPYAGLNRLRYLRQPHPDFIAVRLKYISQPRLIEAALQLEILSK